MASKGREATPIAVMPVDDPDAATSQGFVHPWTKPDTMVFMDDARAYVGLHRPSGRVDHSVKGYVNDMVHTNGIESHWAILKRAYIGVFRYVIRKHLGRYPNEFSGADTAHVRWISKNR